MTCNVPTTTGKNSHDLSKTGRATILRDRPTSAQVTRRVLDVEHALIWVCDEQGKLRDERWPSPGMPSVQPMFRWAVTSGAAEIPQGEPHPDAVTIWQALRDLALPGEPPPQLGYGLWDGLDLARAWQRARDGAVDLAICHARLRSRPPVPDDPLPAGPVKAGNGAPAVLALGLVRFYGARHEDGSIEQWDERRVIAAIEMKLPRRARRKANGHPDGSFCPMRWDPSANEVIKERAEYAAWWLTLEALASALEGRLDTLEVMHPSVPFAPWTPPSSSQQQPRAALLRSIVSSPPEAVV